MKAYFERDGVTLYHGDCRGDRRNPLEWGESPEDRSKACEQ